MNIWDGNIHSGRVAVLLFFSHPDFPFKFLPIFIDSALIGFAYEPCKHGWHCLLSPLLGPNSWPFCCSRHHLPVSHVSVCSSPVTKSRTTMWQAVAPGNTAVLKVVLSTPLMPCQFPLLIPVLSCCSHGGANPCVVSLGNRRWCHSHQFE